MHHRREVLGATVGIAALAGCLDVLPLGNGKSLPEYTEWLPATILEETDSPRLRYHAVDEVVSWPQTERPPTWLYQGMKADDAVESFNGAIRVSDGSEEYGRVYLGSFDLEPIASETWDQADDLPIEGWDGERGGFDVYESEDAKVAMREDVLLYAADVDPWIDALLGETTRLTEADNMWSTVLELLGSSAVVRVEPKVAVTAGPMYPVGTNIAALELWGASIERIDDMYATTSLLYHENEEAAESNREAAEEYFEGQPETDIADWSTTTDGPTLLIETTLPEVETL